MGPEANVKRLLIDLTLDEAKRDQFYKQKDKLFFEYNLGERERELVARFDYAIQNYLTGGDEHDLIEAISGNKTHPLAAKSAVTTVRTTVATTVRTTVATTVVATLRPPTPDKEPPPSDPKDLAHAVRNTSGGERLKALHELVKAIDHPQQVFSPDPGVDTPLNDGANIYIVGLGINGIEQVTRETESILRRCDKVFFLGQGLGVVEYLESLCSVVVDLARETYKENEDRIEAYYRMASAVLAAAVEGQKVGFAIYGHPLVFAYAPFLIRQASALLSLRISVKPGISSLDTLFCDLFVDPAPSGLLIYEASDVLISKRKFLPDVATVVLQIGSVETALYSNSPSVPERFRRFVEHACQFYPSNHIVHAVYSSPTPLLKARKISFELGKMTSYADEMTSGVTLFLPPVAPSAQIDCEMSNLMGSKEHLSIITVRDAR